LETTRLSTKGQIIIPKIIRENRGWKPGLEFTIESKGDSLFLKPVRPFPRREIGEVIGCAGYKGPRRSLKDMEAAIRKGAAESR